MILFVAASASLWLTGARVVERERRRRAAEENLIRAGKALERWGREALRKRPRFPYYWDTAVKEPLRRELAAAVARLHQEIPGVEGGYLVVIPGGEQEFMPELLPRSAARAASGSGELPRLDPADAVETQADAAIRKQREILVVEVVPPETLAIRAAPLRIGERIAAASWTMARLDDPLEDGSIVGYRLSAGLALGGIALSLALMVGLTRTVRRQAQERARLQAELRRSERLAALGKLLAGVAHEVRNPLAGIRSTVQLWQRGIGRDDDDSLADLVHEVDRLEGIVFRLLQFSRADTQELAPGDLNGVVAEAARLARSAAEGQGVAVQTDLEPNLPPVAMVPPALMQVFRNLTTNALQAMPRGGALRLSTRLAAGGQAVAACVADTGPGLPAETLKHLFEPFFTTKPDGTGLGLAIAREIALAHRGELRAENCPDGPGAVFTLLLPVAEAGPTHGAPRRSGPGESKREEEPHFYGRERNDPGR